MQITSPHRKKQRIQLGFKMGWLTSCLAVLAITLYRFDGTPNSDIGVFQIYSMLCLCFPAGFVFLLVASVTLYLLETYFSFVVGSSYPALLIEWLGFFTFGYLQWFWLLPRATDRFFKSRGNPV